MSPVPYMYDSYPRASDGGLETVETVHSGGQTARQFSAAHVAALKSRFASAPPQTGNLNGIAHHHTSSGADVPYETTYTSTMGSAQAWEDVHVKAISDLLLSKPPDVT